MQSKAATVDQYLAELPPDRRAALQAVRATILKNLDKGIAEGMQYGMIGYSVPHSIYPAGYHCDPRQPLPYGGLASQKNHMSFYIMGLYMSCVNGQESDLLKWFRAAWAKSGKKLDMGKACIRFKKIEDVPLDVIGEAVRRVSLKKCIECFEAAILSAGKRTSSAARKSTGGAKTTVKSAKASRTAKVAGSRSAGRKK